MTDYYKDRPAGFWIGHPGALLPLPGIKGDLARTVTRAVAYKTSASGRRRAYLSARRAPLREWKVTIPQIQPQEASILHGLLMETDPPYVWVDPWSRVTNLLTPSTAGLEDCLPVLAAIGRQPLSGGGFAPTAGANPSGLPVDIPPAPVVPELPVTVSVFLASEVGATVSAKFLDSNGVQVGVLSTSAPVVGLDVLRRASVTVAIPPTGAAAVALSISAGASVIAQPAVTWTGYLAAYGAGGGAAQVVIDSLDETIRDAEIAANGHRLSNLSFTVTEVD